MNNAHPIFDTATHYRIEVQGQVDVEWLQGFDNLPQINVDQARQVQDITVLDVHTDQAGIVGLVRRLHGLGIMILQFEVVS